MLLEGWDRSSAWGILGAKLWFEVEGVSQPALLALYAPYCGGLSAEEDLRTALMILQAQVFEGHRPVQGAPGHAYRLSWSGGEAPLEMLPCCLALQSPSASEYRFEVMSHQLVSCLMQTETPAGSPGDLPDGFWHWLLVGSDQSDDSA